MGGDLVVDEVQLAPELLNVVEQLLEEPGGLKFVRTRPSARKLKRTGVDLLAGRAILLRMHPFLALSSETFSIFTRPLLGGGCRWFGTPKARGHAESHGLLYVRPEVQAEGLFAMSERSTASWRRSVSLGKAGSMWQRQSGNAPGAARRSRAICGPRKSTTRNASGRSPAQVPIALTVSSSRRCLASRAEVTARFRIRCRKRRSRP